MSEDNVKPMRHHFLIVDKGKFKHMLNEATDTETIGVSQVLMQANGVSKNAEDADEARLLIAKAIVSNKEADMLNVRLAIHIIVTICLAAYALYLRSDGFAQMSLGAIAFAVSVACVFGYIGVRVLFSPVLEESRRVAKTIGCVHDDDHQYTTDDTGVLADLTVMAFVPDDKEDGEKDSDIVNIPFDSDNDDADDSEDTKGE